MYLMELHPTEHNVPYFQINNEGKKEWWKNMIYIIEFVKDSPLTEGSVQFSREKGHVW